MHIIFRTDASVSIGSGHVMRCLSLATELAKRGAEILFILRGFEGEMSAQVKRRGFACELLPLPAVDYQITDEDPAHASWLGVGWLEDAEETIERIGTREVDWMIVDHYGIDHRWHKKVRSKASRVMVIDDLADRKLDCDLLLDQNYYKDASQRYSKLVDEKSRCLLGPRYMLLRDEFLNKRIPCDQRQSIDTVVVFMGGGDPTNETSKVLNALERFSSQLNKIHVIVGSANPNHQEVEELCDRMDNAECYRDVANMSDFFAMSDLAIGAGGVATLERCYMGLPSVIMITAENQVRTTTDIGETGAIINLGWNIDVSEDELSEKFENLRLQPSKLKKMCHESIQMFERDGFVGLHGIYEVLLDY